MIKDNIIDGDALFGLLQNYIDFMNNNENPVINSALQNILLSKANNESEYIMEIFKNELNQKFENKYPLSSDERREHGDYGLHGGRPVAHREGMREGACEGSEQLRCPRRGNVGGKPCAQRPYRLRQRRRRLDDAQARA